MTGNDQKTGNVRVVIEPLEFQADPSLMAEGRHLKREWGFWAILGFTTTSLATWEGAGAYMGVAFTNGGPSAIVYGYLCAVLGITLIYASMAEMASILPIAGAQYHWTAMFAPRRFSRFLSYLQGWTTIWAWQFGNTTGCFVISTLITGMVTLNYPSYSPKQWHLCVMMITFAAIECLVTIFGRHILPLLETTSGICNVLFFVIIVIVVLTTGERQPSTFVWANFQNNGGWRSDGISFCLGFLGPTLALAGADGCVHLAEESRRPTRDIPWTIIGSGLISAFLGFAFIIVLLYSVTDVTAALTTPTGYPAIEILYQATNSYAATTVMTSMALSVGIFGQFAIMAGTSRLIWAFARDKGLPFSATFSKVSPTYHAPIHAILLCSAVSVLLSLIVLGNTTAFFALLSLSTIAFYFSYMIPIGAFLYARLTNPQEIQYGPWRLGHLGIPINSLALAFSIFLIVFLPFPAILPVTVQTFNYAGPIFGAVVLGAGVDWYMRARQSFCGPDVAKKMAAVARNLE